MLSDIILDDEEYDAILNEAVNMVISIYPEWTDFNAHDPGVTILELFAALKESQQFFLDQIGEENEKKYLKLMGIKRRKKQPAHSLVRIESGGSYVLPASCKLDSGGLCFETEAVKRVIGKDINFCLTVHGITGNVEAFINHSNLEFSDRVRFLPFGRNPVCGSAFYICFWESLPIGVPLHLYAGVYQEEGVVRNGLQDDFAFSPFVMLVWQYFTGRGWENLCEIEDGTYAFLFDGFICFQTAHAMEKTSVCGREGYFIRAVLEEGEYDIPPVLTKVSMNICEVVQKETFVECMVVKNQGNSLMLSTQLSVFGTNEVYIGRGALFYPTDNFKKEICGREGGVRLEIGDQRVFDADCVMVIGREPDCIYKRVLGIGTGFPYQEIDLEDLQVVYESFEILIQDTEQADGYCLWQKVEDFAGSSSEDRHYIFDSKRGVVLFGDCIHGMAPEGEILLAGYQRTAGSDGNVKAGKISCFRREGMEDVAVSNICEGYGGCDEETIDECFVRARRRIREADCAVTREDYERYAKQTPALMIESCKVLNQDDVKRFVKKTDETAVYLVVKPCCTEMGSLVQKYYYQNIRNYLERYRMIGIRVYVFFPEYVEIEVSVEAVVKPQYLHVEERVRQAVQEFFDTFKGTFGSVIASGRLYGFLDRQDFILEIRSLGMEHGGGRVQRNAEGDILLAPYGTAVLKEVRMSLNAE